MLETIQTPGDTRWFTQDRFGLFIHWGLYALAARHEWMMSREKTPVDVYESKYFKHFDPDLYNPDNWARAAADAGMKYFVVTTKHHDGFCLWDTQFTDYKVTNTPHGKDVLRPMVEAFNSRGLRTGFYHSLLDWHHPQYVIDQRNHPRRDEVATNPDLNAGRDQAKYADYLYNQVHELLTTYDNVDVLWFDFSFVDTEARLDFVKGKGREAWNSRVLYDMIRKVAPNIILSDRLDLEMVLSGGDVKTPEQYQPLSWVPYEGQPVTWEACQTFSGSWGYYRDEHSWRSVKQLIVTLIDCVSKGGNLLLNVGPTGRGELDERALDRLTGIGKWMHHHNRSIYGCTQAPAEFTVPPDCRLTYHPERKRLYAHLINWPYKHVNFKGKAFTERVEYAQFLHDASELSMAVNPRHARQYAPDEEVLVLEVPLTEPNVDVAVIELFLK